jgi:hypothetical protein
MTDSHRHDFLFNNLLFFTEQLQHMGGVFLFFYQDTMALDLMVVFQRLHI